MNQPTKLLHGSLADLGANDISTRIAALANLTEQPDVARPLLVELIADRALPTMTRVWGMIAICIIKDNEQGLAAETLVAVLDASEAVLRRCAIETLGHLKVEWAAGAIAQHLDDDEEIPESWFDDDSTPAQAARRALASIGTEAAIAALSPRVRS